jgi:putative membrane protein
MSRAFVLSAAAAMTFVAAGTVRAQASPAGPAFARGTAAANTADAVFIAKAAEAAAADAALARLGAAKAMTRDVRVFAQRLAQGRSALAREIATLARSKSVDLAPPPAEVRRVGADLAPLTGPAFDRAFMAAATRAHAAAVALFEAQSRDGHDADVKEWASRHLPAMRDQLTRAQAIKPARRS